MAPAGGGVSAPGTKGKAKTKITKTKSKSMHVLMAPPAAPSATTSSSPAPGRVVDPYRSRLDPEMVQALICTKDWVAAANKDQKKVGTIVNDLEVDALTNDLARLKIEGNNEEEGEDAEEDSEEEEDMGIDLDIMDGAAG